MKYPAILLAVASIVSAQTTFTEYLPPCSFDCYAAAVVDGTECEITDSPCQCIQANFQQIFSFGASCMIDDCTGDVVVGEVIPAARRFCSAVTAVPSSTSSTLPPASSSTSTSSVATTSSLPATSSPILSSTSSAFSSAATSSSSSISSSASIISSFETSSSFLASSSVHTSASTSLSTSTGAPTSSKASIGSTSPSTSMAPLSSSKYFSRSYKPKPPTTASTSCSQEELSKLATLKTTATLCTSDVVLSSSSAPAQEVHKYGDNAQHDGDDEYPHHNSGSVNALHSGEMKYSTHDTEHARPSHGANVKHIPYEPKNTPPVSLHSTAVAPQLAYTRDYPNRSGSPTYSPRPYSGPARPASTTTQVRPLFTGAAPRIGSSTMAVVGSILLLVC